MLGMTSLFPEPGRLAAHVLLDAASAWDDDDPMGEANGNAMNTALTALGETGAVEILYDEETEAFTVRIDNLAGGAVVVIHYLLDLSAQLATKVAEKPKSRHDIIVAVREYLDSEGEQ